MHKNMTLHLHFYQNSRQQKECVTAFSDNKYGVLTINASFI